MANAVRDNPERAEFVGYSQRVVRLVSFCAAGFFAGLAGGLNTLYLQVVPIDTLYWTTSGQVVMMALLGGAAWVAHAWWMRTHPSACPYSLRLFVELPHPWITRQR